MRTTYSKGNDDGRCNGSAGEQRGGGGVQVAERQNCTYLQQDVLRGEHAKDACTHHRQRKEYARRGFGHSPSVKEALSLALAATGRRSARASLLRRSSSTSRTRTSSLPVSTRLRSAHKIVKHTGNAHAVLSGAQTTK